MVALSLCHAPWNLSFADTYRTDRDENQERPAEARQLGTLERQKEISIGCKSKEKPSVLIGILSAEVTAEENSGLVDQSIWLTSLRFEGRIVAGRIARGGSSVGICFCDLCSFHQMSIHRHLDVQDLRVTGD